MRSKKRPGRGRRRALGALLSLLVSAASGAAAQELNPRAYAPMPTGANIVMLSYGRSSGGVLFDPSLPVEDVHAVIHASALLYGHSFGLLGRSANAIVALPYAWGSMDGLLSGEYLQITRSGLADLRGQLTVNLIGGPALAPREFATQRPTTILGVSVAVAAPTGQYDPAKLVNIGSNRWSFKPEVGFSRTKGRWYLELYGGAWVFGTNRNYYGGGVREQDPIGTFQAHVSYTFKPRLWLAGDATFYTGGRTTVNGTAKADLQKNSRLGAALALPVGKRSALKVSWATGFTTRIGADFDSFGVAFQTVWFGRP
jgi:hypothetical protein